MGLTRPYTIKHANGQLGVAELMDCVNVARTPQVRQKILNGKFHRIAAADGSGFITVEKPFFYADFSRNHFILVKPRGERHTWKESSKQLERMVSKVPSAFTNGNQRTIRVVFGMGELREKLVAEDNSLDDRMLELLKVLVIYDHPFLIKRPRLRIFLERITDTSYDFACCYDHNPGTFRVRMMKGVAETLMNEKKTTIVKWVKENHNENIFELKHDHWINFWRWSPVTVALSSLKDYEKIIEDGNKINVREKEFKNMLKYLPRGSQLPSWAKKSLQKLFTYIKKNHPGPLEKVFFEIRFDRELDDDWYKNDDPDDIDTLWKLLQHLPDTNVEGNTQINDLLIDKGEGGGWYDPNTNDIGIGSEEIYDKDQFENTVLHEVGHAVHEQKQKLVDKWLEKQFGWQTFDTNDRDIDAWVNLMGGYGELTSEQKKDVRDFLRRSIGEGDRWEPPRRVPVPKNHPCYDEDYAPRRACDFSKADWHESFKTWFRQNNKAFVLNFYYKKFMVVNETTLELIKKMPSNYAAMSPMEFFAELYALYYDPNKKYLGKKIDLPDYIEKWFRQNIGIADRRAKTKKKK